MTSNLPEESVRELLGNAAQILAGVEAVEVSDDAWGSLLRVRQLVRDAMAKLDADARARDDAQMRDDDRADYYGSLFPSHGEYATQFPPLAVEDRPMPGEPVEPSPEPKDCPMCGDPGGYGHVCPEHSD